MSSKFLAFLIALAIACYYVGCWSAEFLGNDLAIGLTGLLFLSGFAVYEIARQIQASSKSARTSN